MRLDKISIAIACIFILLFLVIAYDFGRQDGVKQEQEQDAKAWIMSQHMVRVQVEHEGYGYLDVAAFAPETIELEALAKELYEFNQTVGGSAPTNINDSFPMGNGIWLPEKVAKDVGFEY